MDPSHNFPPSPREMYMYQPAQRVNGHKVQSPSPTRGRPPPVLPERKPETQLSNRVSRPSLTSLDSASFDVASPPHSPGYHGHRQPHQGQIHYPDSKPFSYAAAINSPQIPHKHGVHEDSTRVKLQRDASPRSHRGNVVSEGYADIHRYGHQDDYASQNTAAVYQRIERNRTISTPDTFLSGGHDCYDSEPFHTYDSFGQSEGIYGQFVQPANGSQHRPSLTYVPPPVVPSLPEFGKVDKPTAKDQQIHLQEQQQPKVVTKNVSSGMPLDAASPHNHHPPHHHHKNHHHTHQQHDQSQVLSRHHSHHSPATSSSPLVSPKRTNSTKMKSKQDKLPHPPSIPVPPPPPPPPPPPVHDKHVSVVANTRAPSPPLPPPPSEPGFSSRTRSSKKRIEPCPQSPLASNSKTVDTQPHQLCMSGPALHQHHHHHHHHLSHVDFQPTDLPQNNHHQVKAPTAQAPPPPPPPPPARTSSTPQLLTNQHPDLNPTPPGIRSPRSGSPARHQIQKQTSLATMDDLAQIKLRTVGDSSPSSPVLSPVTAGDISSGALNVRLRPTPGKFRNIYVEDETTLPPPPPLDDLDELPPPPPPPELLSGDLSNVSLNTTTHQKSHSAPAAAHPNQLHCPPGEGDSLHIDHRLVQQQTGQRQPVSTPKAHNQDSAGSKAGACGSSRLSEDTPSSLGQLIAEAVSMMDFDIPDDIDLSQCPGLVEITRSTPNWKKDMIEKKNQEKIEEYVKAILKEREQQAKWKNVPEWKRKILQKKEEEDAAAGVSQPAEVKTPVGKKAAKKAPVPPPKETKEDSAQPKPKGDIVPAALSIDPEELAAMPPWKQELLFKRGKVPVTFSNEFNPDEEEKADNENVPAS